VFVPLHTKSEHSAGYGTASVDELVRRVRDHGYRALALTDLENLYGQVKFHHAARHYGVKPITGVELRSGHGPGNLGRKEGRLVLLARDRAGYESLCRIITWRHSGGDPGDDDPIRCLDAQPRGLFFLSDDPLVLGRLLKAGVGGADLRFLLVRPGGGSPPTGVRVAADPDVVLADPADRNLHILLMAIRRGQRFVDVADGELPQRSLPSQDVFRRLYQDAPDALDESIRIAEACNFDLTALHPVLPLLDPAAGDNADQRLERICGERFAQGQRDGKWKGPLYHERLARELAILRQLGFAAYFLIVAAITDEARLRRIAVGGRGSAAGSLVAHVLGITAIDPIQHGLYFERFIHAQRKDLPDIDLDIPSERRQELIEWVFERFGQERVAMVSAHQTFGLRAAFREGLKAFGMRPAEIDRFCEQIPPDGLETDATPPLPLELLNGSCRAFLPLILRLVGKMQHISVHPGGVVIAEPRIDHYAPLERAPKGVLVTQYDMHSLARIGLVKIDLLGNRALSAVQETLRLIGSAPTMADGDPATLRTLHEARTVGCFQIETPALRATLKKLRVQSIQDLVAALAIVRPGPASGEAKAGFIRRANGEEPAQPPHPRLTELLRETRGMPLYEEHLMVAIAAMTGWSLERADDMRAALIDAAEDQERLRRLENEFLNAAAQTGVLGTDAARVWSVLVRFAAYSFNKAHAISYAQLAWQTAYLKTHYPVAFACGVLNSYGGLYALRTVAADFARQGLRLRLPHVNCSQVPCTVEAGAVRIGLAAIKHVTAKTRARILDRRPFASFAEFLEKTALPHRELEALVLSGACDGLSPLAPEAYPIAHEDILSLLKENSGAKALEGFVVRRPGGPRAEIYRALVRARNELLFLDMHISDHPMRALREEARRQGCITTTEAQRYKGRPVRVAGLVAAARRLATQDHKVMQFVTFEDEDGLVEAVLFPQTYAVLRDPVTSPGPYLVGGRVAEDHGDVHLQVSEVMPFHERPAPYRTA
jgi:DNA polymerase III subunit alpha